MSKDINIYKNKENDINAKKNISKNTFRKYKQQTNVKITKKI